MSLIANSIPIVFVSIVIAIIFKLPALYIYLRSIENEQYQANLREQFKIETKYNFLIGDLLERARNESLWEACDKITSGEQRFWFYPKNEKPRNIFEEIAQEIYKNTSYWETASSFEYWCNILPSTHRRDHPWHNDRDEDILEKEHKLVVPLRGAIYYGPFTSYVGGDFHMIPSVPYQGSRRYFKDECHEPSQMCISHVHAFRSNRPKDALFVKTQPNLLLFANVTHFHRVTEVMSGRRFALAVNADHWLPYKVEKSLNNDEILQLASSQDVFNAKESYHFNE